jgi:hypothetical protein
MPGSEATFSHGLIRRDDRRVPKSKDKHDEWTTFSDATNWPLMSRSGEEISDYTDYTSRFYFKVQKYIRSSMVVEAASGYGEDCP